MTSLSRTPFKKQNPEEVAALVRNLEEHSKKAKKSTKGSYSCRKATFEVEGSPAGLTVDSWRFQDWSYSRPDLPTYARGLFTCKNLAGQYEIVARGYDKFFNIDEVGSTNWASIEKNTIGPYELSVKENGCIIFISGLEDGTLLVCSKHSTGSTDSGVSHAIVGEGWVDKHLASVGKHRSDLAKRLREMNATAVAELCDDSFEEHVLAYDEKAAGLYLHGINLNLPEFSTYSGSEVHKFADEWGFKKAQYVMKRTLASVRTFLDECAETGSWSGRDTEGFVIRCRSTESEPEGVSRDWFFKYKFEEPYLMYRQWREATKAVIAGKQPKIRKHKQITEEYLFFARQQLAKDPKLGIAYNLNHGIIAMRDKFLDDRGLKGSDIIRQEREQDDQSDEVTNNVVLVPIATLGCGKTTVALALVNLFNWGHVQNDNIEGRNRPQRFANQVTNQMATHPVVIADRNNHQTRERKQLIDDVSRIVPGTRFVALHYVHEPKSEMLPKIRKVTQDRVFSRGDNHQTIHTSVKPREEIIGIMDGFLHRFEPINMSAGPDCKFDEVINLDILASNRANLEKIITHLHTVYPKLFGDMPSSQDLDDAFDNSLKEIVSDQKKFELKNHGHAPYKAGAVTGMASMSADGNVNSSKSGGKPPKTKSRTVEYFCVSLTKQDILDTISAMFPADGDAATCKMYRQLQGMRRIQSSFHVTLIHRATHKQYPELWAWYIDKHKAELAEQADGINSAGTTDGPVLGRCRVQLERIVWSERVMCIVVRLISPMVAESLTDEFDDGIEPSPSRTPNRNADGQALLWRAATPITHITIGTADDTVRPKESNALLATWIAQGTVNNIREVMIPGVKVVDGVVRSVFSRR